MDTDIQINWIDLFGAIVYVRFFDENFGIWEPRNLMKFVNNHGGNTVEININLPSRPKRTWVKNPNQPPKLEMVVPPKDGFDKTKWQKFYDDLSADDKVNFLTVIGKELANYLQFTQPVKVQDDQLLVHFVDVWQTLLHGFNVYAGDEPDFMVFLKSKNFCDKDDWDTAHDSDQIVTFFKTLSSDDQRSALSTLKEDWDIYVNEY